MVHVLIPFSHSSIRRFLSIVESNVGTGNEFSLDMMAQSLGEGGSEGEREREGEVERGEGGMEKEGEATTSVACSPATFGRLWGASPAHHILLCFGEGRREGGEGGRKGGREREGGRRRER